MRLIFVTMFKIAGAGISGADPPSFSSGFQGPDAVD
jgi:hypothetical protein